MQGATNSKGIAEHADARAFRDIEVEEVLLAEGHGEATSVQGDTGSIAFVIHRTTIPSMHVRILVLPVNLLVRGLGLVQVFLVVSSGVVDDEDDACTDGTVTDIIHSASNSVIQGLSEYHDDSCTRRNALLYSRMGRGHGGRGMGVLALLVLPSYLQDLGCGGVPIAGHARWAEVGGGIICVTLEELTGMHKSAPHVFGCLEVIPLW